MSDQGANATVAWLIERSQYVLPKSPLGRAIANARSQWGDLQTYTRDGDLSYRQQPLGTESASQAFSAKNRLFFGSDRGGRTAAILFSLVGSCRRIGGDTFSYLKDVLERLPTHPADRLAELLPDAWFAAHRNARRKVAS